MLGIILFSFGSKPYIANKALTINMLKHKLR